MTSSREDYLKLIYKEGGLNQLVSNKVLQEKLAVSGASVSEMIAKLKQEELITTIPYKGSMLTEKGLSVCMGLVRSHRLWEVFLIRHLGYTWREAHEEAHKLEHSSSKLLIDRLEKFLCYPKYCPHGDMIPTAEMSVLPVVHYKLLSEIQAGESVTISRIIEDGALLDYVQGTGIQIGSTVKVLSLEEYEGPLHLMQGEKSIVLSYKAATQIFVNPIK